MSSRNHYFCKRRVDTAGLRQHCHSSGDRVIGKGRQETFAAPMAARARSIATPETRYAKTPSSVRAGPQLAEQSLPMAKALMPTFSSAAEQALQQSQARGWELEVHVESLNAQVQALDLVVKEQQDVIDCLEEQSEAQQVRHRQDFEAVVEEVEEQNRFIQQLQILAEEKEGQSKAATRAMERELDQTRRRYEARIGEQQREQDLLHTLERERQATSFVSEREHQATSFVAELDRMHKETAKNLATKIAEFTNDTSEVRRKVAQEVAAIRQDTDARVQTYKNRAAEKEAELDECRTELAELDGEFQKASQVIARLQQQLDFKSHTLEQSENALRLHHDSLADLNKKYEIRGGANKLLEIDKAAALTLVLDLQEALKLLETDKTAALMSVVDMEEALVAAKQRTQELIESFSAVAREQAGDSLEHASMKNERDLATKQVKKLEFELQQMSEKMNDAVNRFEKEKQSQVTLIQSTLEQQIDAMQQEFRMDMERLHSESSRKIETQDKLMAQKIQALEQVCWVSLPSLILLPNSHLKFEDPIFLHWRNQSRSCVLQSLRQSETAFSPPEFGHEQFYFNPDMLFFGVNLSTQKKN